MSNSDKSYKTANLTDIFQSEDTQGSWVGERLVKMIKESVRSETPPFPKQIQIEVSNICNHSCSFCAYTTMQRKKEFMTGEMFTKTANEAYKLGAREIGLFAGAEPLTCKNLDEYIKECKEIGYEYQYISTNGSIGDESTFKKLIDAGLNSIKFSVNAGNKEVYKKVHGRDHFDRVIKNIKYVSQYRRENDIKMFLGVSFVGMPETKDTFPELQDTIGEYVDEMIYYEASNQSGQMPELPMPPYRECHLPFNKAHISLEGYLKACCNDYENYLTIADLKKMSLLEAWHSDIFKDLRRKHLDDDLDGTLCGNCISGCTSEPKPLNPGLAGDLPKWLQPKSGE